MSQVAPGKSELPIQWRANVGDYATCLAYSANGTLCAVGTGAGEVHVLEARSGSLRWKAMVHAGGVQSVAFHPKSPLLATSGQDGQAQLLQARDGATLAKLPGTAAWTEQVAWSPDGTKLAAASGKVVRLWNEDGSPHLATEEHPSTVTGLAWGRTGAQLATAAYGGVFIWSIESGARTRHFPWKGSLISIAWSPDGKVIACGSQDCSVHFWRLSTGKDAEMTGYPFKSRVIAWDAKGRLLATSGEAIATLWDFSGNGPEGSRPIQLAAHQGVLTALAFSPRRTVLASGAQDAGVILWEPRKSTLPMAYGFLDDYVSGLAWNPRLEAITGIDGSGNVVTWSAV
jgi:WD40 repeat protein